MSPAVAGRPSSPDDGDLRRALQAGAGYRPDIDGLRALAVLAVMVYHAFPDALPGGYVGVDVFFVISGFLITRLVGVGLERGRFDYRGFLARRVRRLFPALALVLVAVLVAGGILLLPDEYRQLGAHAAGGAGFVSNFVLLGEVDYFDNAAATKPLLHLWSLAIEEQFYLGWPLLMLLAWRRPGSLRVVAPVLLAVSLLAWAWLWPRDPAAAFYLPVTRAWELLAGACLVVAVRDGSGPRPAVAGWLGLALVVAAVALPAVAPAAIWRSPLAVAGTALVIFAGVGAGPGRRLLSMPWLVTVGLMSYPLYLWHWPLLAFTRIVLPAEPAAAVKLALLAGSLGLAYATWRWIERPTRTLRAEGRHGAWIWLLPLMLVLAAAGLLVWRADGFEQRRANRMPGLVSAAALDRYRIERQAAIRSGACHFKGARQPLDEFRTAGRVAGCLQPQPGRDHLLVLGDSLGADTWLAMARAWPHRRVLQYTAAGCRPADPVNACTRLMDEALAALRGTPLRAVVLSTRWQGLGEDPAAQQRLRDLVQRIAAEHPVLLVGPPPEFSRDVKSLLGRLPTGADANAHAAAFLVPEPVATVAALKALADGERVVYLDRRAAWCGEPPRCPVTDGRRLFIADYGHLTVPGSTRLASRLRDLPLPPAR